MAIEPPADVVSLLHMMGFHWPDIDEDIFQDLGDTLGTVGAEIATQTERSDQAIHALKGTVRSDAYDVLTWRWDGGARPHLSEVAGAFNDMHLACVAIHDAVVAVKSEILFRASLLLAEFTISQIAAVIGDAAGGLPGVLIEGAEAAVIWAAKAVFNNLMSRLETQIFEYLIRTRLGGVRTELDRHIESLVRDGFVDVVNS